MQIYLSQKEIKALVFMIQDAEGMMDGGDWGCLSTTKKPEYQYLYDDICTGVYKLKEKLTDKGFTEESLGLNRLDP